jgi:hypothetical protein
MAEFKGWSFEGERREHSRVPLRAPVMIDSQSTYQSGDCRDVSAGGVAVTVDSPPDAGALVEVYFELPTGIAVEAKAEVIRIDGHLVALRFLELESKARTALVAYCELSGVRRIVLIPQQVTT